MIEMWKVPPQLCNNHISRVLYGDSKQTVNDNIDLDKIKYYLLLHY